MAATNSPPPKLPTKINSGGESTTGKTFSEGGGFHSSGNLTQWNIAANYVEREITVGTPLVVLIAQASILPHNSAPIVCHGAIRAKGLLGNVVSDPHWFSVGYRVVPLLDSPQHRQLHDFP
ncbi:MAG TPA: hypothetical protein VN809_04460, partial [Telmatospirillum sp.]|nr:hypothetical protein [Telmatospirillum sp.]